MNAFSSIALFLGVALAINDNAINTSFGDVEDILRLQCPHTRPSGACHINGQKCYYGEQHCCGKSFPMFEAQCFGGQWGVIQRDDCFGPCPGNFVRRLTDDTRNNKFGDIEDVLRLQCPHTRPSGSCHINGQKCYYGEKHCCGQSFPVYDAQCFGGHWGVIQREDCFGQCPSCPAQKPSVGATCSTSVNTKTCEYGQQTCCGQTHPTTTAKCLGNQWALIADDSCLAPCPCPHTMPQANGPCRFEGRCYYGRECCNGRCHASYQATCSGGRVGLLATDACFHRGRRLETLPALKSLLVKEASM